MGRRIAVLAFVAALVGLVVWRLGPLPQDPRYHAFADTRAFLGLPRAADVLSNVPFAIVGLLGLAALRHEPLDDAPRHAAYRLYCGTGVLTALGSAWYHARPTSATLVWDRLPLAAMLAAFLVIVLGEHVGPAAFRALAAATTVAVASVAWWAGTEGVGMGDLRPYLFVQAGAVALVPVAIALFPAADGLGRWRLGAWGLYGLAKVLEAADAWVFAASGGLVSGHTLKHLVAGAASALPLYVVWVGPASQAKRSEAPLRSSSTRSLRHTAE